MQLSERHIIKEDHLYFKECDNITFKSKNLYNSCLYTIRQPFINDNVNVSFDLHHLIKNHEAYKELPAKVSSSVILMVQKNFKSYFKATSAFYKTPEKFKGKPKLPYYLNKLDGRFVASYTNQAISKISFNKYKKIKLSNTNIELNTKIKQFTDIDCVRIVPKLGYFVIEVIYTIPDTPLLEDNNNYLGIDLGINNLATLSSNEKSFKPIIINGKPLKSINQFYNKKLSKIKSTLEVRNKKSKSKKLYKLTNKRHFKVETYLHKASKEIVKLAKNNNINTIIVGKNEQWKQNINIGKVNNQKFVSIPHSRFIEMIQYKCEKEGLNFKINEESYTSKASFLDLDEIPTYNSKNKETYNFSGYRKYRGLYKSKITGKQINADVNGSYNIIRKAIPNVFKNDGIEGVGVHPIIKQISFN